MNGGYCKQKNSLMRKKSKMTEATRWANSAEIYAEISPHIPYYFDSSRAIAEFAAVKTPRSMMSLGCGSSGLLENLLLSSIHGLESMYCVDISVAMLNALKSRVFDPRVSFLELSADDLNSVNLLPVDCIVCSSALWLFDLPVALPAIGKKISVGGDFIFTIAEWDLADYQLPSVSQMRYRLIDETLNRRSLPPKPSRGSIAKITTNELYRQLNIAGLEISQEISTTSKMKGADWEDFYSIPAIAARSLPHLELSLSLDVLQEAMSKIGSLNYGDTLNWRLLQCKRR